MSREAMHIGFTGAQKGMTRDQLSRFADAIRLFYRPTDSYPMVFHHGDCIGADATAYDIVTCEFPDARIVVHAPIDESKRAFCGSHRKDNDTGIFVCPAKNYLARNRDIVHASHLLVATPRTTSAPPPDKPMSGTWYTINYALGHRTAGVLVIMPNGTIEMYRYGDHLSTIPEHTDLRKLI